MYKLTDYIKQTCIKKKLEQLHGAKNMIKITIVILFFLLGVSAKHFIDDDSTTVSQNETTGSAT